MSNTPYHRKHEIAEPVFFVSDYWFPKIGGLERSIDYLGYVLCNQFPIYLITTGPQWDRDDEYGLSIKRFTSSAADSYYPQAFNFVASYDIPHPIVHMFGFSYQWPQEHTQFIRRLKTELGAIIVLKSPTLGDVTSALSADYRNVLDYIDTFIALTDAVEKELLACRIPAHKIARISNGVPVDLYEPTNKEYRRFLRNKRSLPLDRLIIGHAGRFVLRKRIDVLIDAIAQVPLELRPALLLVGDTDYTFNDPFVIEPFVNDDIYWISSQYDMREIYKLMDVYSSASEAEGMSNSLLEALASGLPIVASDIPGHREAVITGVNGWLFSPGNVAELSSILIQLARLHEQNDLSNYSVQSRNLAVKRFNEIDIAEQYIDLYRQLRCT